MTRGLRVIAGSARGHRLIAPRGAHTRPTADRVKESAFSALGPDRIADARVLDGYGGSGALAIEALSRGARSADIVESDRRALAAIEANVAATGFAPQVRLFAGPLERFLLRRDPRGPAFDLVFLDPPYGQPTADLLAVLDRLRTGGRLGRDARVLVERSARSGPVAAEGFVVPWSRTYGDTLVAVLAPIPGPAPGGPAD